MLEIDNVELSFDTKKILWSIYIKAEKGKITSILGKNGSGKSSLLKIIFGNLTPKYVTIRINTKYTKNPLYKYHKLSFLPQHSLLPRHITVETAFNFFRVDWNLFISSFENFKRYKKTKVSDLSSGEIRILETYLVLQKESEIILLDEPFSFIAPIYIEKIKQLLIKAKENKIVIITDHYFKEVLSVSDCMYLLKDGNCKLISNKEVLQKEGYLSINQ